MIDPVVRVLVADGHPSVRENLRYSINAEADMYCVGVARDATQVVEQCRALNPAVVVLGDSLAGADSFDVAKLVLLALPDTRVILYTADREKRTDPRHILVCACVDKDSTYAALLHVVREVVGLPARPGPAPLVAGSPA